MCAVKRSRKVISDRTDDTVPMLNKVGSVRSVGRLGLVSLGRPLWGRSLSLLLGLVSLAPTPS